VKQKHPQKKERGNALSGEKITVILIAVVVGALLIAAAVIGIVTLVNSSEEESSSRNGGGSFSDLFTDDYETEGDFRYTIQNGTASIYQYMGSSAEVTVPETLGGYTVTELSAYSFIGNEEITAVTIPKTVLLIGTDAFGSAPLATVTYLGSEEEWNAVVVQETNTALLGAKLIYSGKSN